MRGLLILWFTPLISFCGWYFLSLADVGQTFGGIYLSRDLNEGVFMIYGHLLGVEPDRLPAMFAAGLALDSAVLLGFIAFRRRRAIAAWWRQNRRADNAPEMAQSSASTEIIRS